MDDVLDKRMDQLENMVWEFPTMINTRFARFDTEFTSIRNALVDNTTRIVGLERAVGMLQVDVRDMRSGVTRQLMEQDKRLAAMEDRLSGVEGQLSGVEGQLSGVEGRLSGVEGRLSGVEGRLSGVEGRLSGVESEMKGLSAGVAEILRRLPKS